jgi:hypothetical protein
MFYIVELTIAETIFIGRMNEMRTWLDHRHIEPTMFRIVDGEAPGEVRISFSSEGDATAFATEFGGEVSAVAGVAAVAAGFNSRSASSSGSGRVRPS